jgi:hypothetical protein
MASKNQKSGLPHMYYSLLNCQSKTSDSSSHQQHENTGEEGNTEVE